MSSLLTAQHNADRNNQTTSERRAQAVQVEIRDLLREIRDLLIRVVSPAGSPE